MQETGQRVIVTGSALHWLDLKKVIFIKLLHSKVSEQANMLISTGLPRPGPLAQCILKAQEVTDKYTTRGPEAF